MVACQHLQHSIAQLNAMSTHIRKTTLFVPGEIDPEAFVCEATREKTIPPGNMVAAVERSTN